MMMMKQSASDCRNLSSGVWHSTIRNDYNTPGLYNALINCIISP